MINKILVTLLLVVGLLTVTAKPAQASFNIPHCPHGTHGFWPICIPNSTPTPSATPTATPEETDEPTYSPEPTVEPTATPEATIAPEATERPYVAPDAAGAPTCDGVTPAPITHAVAKRLNGQNAVIAYWPTVLGGTVNVSFREVGQVGMKHALRDYPNFGVAPIGALKAGVKYEYQLTNGHGCLQSNWSIVFASF